MFRRFAKRENVFVKLIREQASLTLEGLEALKEYMAAQTPEASARLNAKEKQDIDEPLEKENLKEEIKKQINNILKDGEIEDVYFDEFVIS